MIHPRLNLISALTSIQRHEDCLEHARTAVAAEPSNADRPFMLGVTYTALNRHKEACAAYAQALDLNPRFKEAYINNDASLLKLGDLARCRAFAERAIAEGRKDASFKFWTHPLQRPPALVSGLTTRAWHDPKDFKWMAMLEAHYGEIMSELEPLLAERSSGGAGMPSQWGRVGGRATHDGSLVRTGEWREWVLLKGGGVHEAGARRCPKTAALLERIPAALGMAKTGLGEALFSVLAPGTHLRPHCGSTNQR
eukprot:CAMPEP_0170160574 /NCGR_PEP_ID=MMETSP0033_2-20121228/73827_1 /TAXON_ID=195969 /ORGANISM="Dolichomastix tenuilepis, Strain CCMP3274" /LENGTH=252 /DNA_ID=CAMNT_0010398131 /DNA_START=3 /DNA_END=757 /DNA_ORIENTATION=+